MITGYIIRHTPNHATLEHKQENLGTRTEAETWLRNTLEHHQHSQPFHQLTGHLTEWAYDYDYEYPYATAETNRLHDPLDQITWDDQEEVA